MLLETGGLVVATARFRNASRPIRAVCSDMAEPTSGPMIEEAVRSLRQSGTSQRGIARELNIDRRRVKRMLDQAGNSG